MYDDVGPTTMPNDTLALCGRLSMMIDRDVDYPDRFPTPVSRAEFASMYESAPAFEMTTTLRRWLLKLCCARRRFDLVPVLTAATTTSPPPHLSGRRRHIRIDESHNRVFHFDEKPLADDDAHNARAARNVEQLVMAMMAIGDGG